MTAAVNKNKLGAPFNWSKAIIAGVVGAVVAAIVAGLYGLIINSTVGPALAPVPPDETAPNAVPFVAYFIATLIFSTCRVSSSGC